MTFFEALCDYKILEVLQNILIDTEKHSFNNLSIPSDKSINEGSSFEKDSIEETPALLKEHLQDKPLIESQKKNNEFKEEKIESNEEEEKKNCTEKGEFKNIEQIEKVKSNTEEKNEEESHIQEKIRINSIEILINIVTLTPSKIFCFRL